MSIVSVHSELATGKHHAINGWTYWLVREAGPLLVDVRMQYLMDAERAEGIDPKIFRTAFWDGLFNYCSDRPDFVEAYGDQSNRYESSGWNISFSLGLRGANALAYYVRRGTWVGASFWTADFSLYERLPEWKAEVDELLGCDGGEVVWNDANEKSRELLVKLPANLAPDYWDELYPWIADRLLGIRKIAGWLRQCDGRQSGVAQDAK
ncbi:MAG TPA: hypothetical protein DD645_00900 [Olsenella sp.]|nr:hypothetical protein [Olsenella sp.]